MLNFNNLLNYIKMEIGVDTNYLELNDEDIINYILNHTMPYFSNFEPLYKHTIIYKTNEIMVDFKKNTYIIPMENENDEIIEVNDVYFYPSYLSNSNTLLRYNGVSNYMLDEVYNQMIDSLLPVQTFEYIQPSKQSDNRYSYKPLIRFELPLTNDILIKMSLVHKELQTISFDMYNLVFKDLCLRDIIRLVISRRSKYQNISTNIGEITINMEFLERRLSELNEKLRENLENNMVVDKVFFGWL